MLKPDEIAKVFNDNGLDTVEKLTEFVTGSLKPAKRAKIEEEIAKVRKDFEKQQQDHNNKLAELQAKLNEVK